jgi:glycyl-tRNA synthetase
VEPRLKSRPCSIQVLQGFLFPSSQIRSIQEVSMTTETSTVTLDKVISLAKRRGFVYPTSDIYGGLASSYDYGPLGAELLRSIRNLWWEEMITRRTDMIGIDSQILLHPETWVASGHVNAFNDPLVEDKVTHKRYRADHLISAWLEKNPQPEEIIVEGLSLEDMGKLIERLKIKSPEGNEILPPKAFNIMFQSSIGVVEGEKFPVYLRGETAQGIFTNFANIINSTRMQLPFGVGQVGKSFRNEITTGQFIFRTLEFEQAEIEYFFDPDATPWEPLFKEWQAKMWDFITGTMGIRPENLRWRRHSDQERSFYSKETYDLEYNYPFGFKELWGIAYRTNYDLQQHIDHSGKDLRYQDPRTNNTFVPHVIEPAVGVNRLLLMAMCDAYWEDPQNTRTVLRFAPALAPYKVAVFPLLKNKPDLVEKARKVFQTVSRKFAATWDERGNIGKRYYSQDEIGTPFCVTIDFQTLEDDTVTIRERDSMQQRRVAVSDLISILRQEIDPD